MEKIILKRMQNRSIMYSDCIWINACNFSGSEVIMPVQAFGESQTFGDEPVHLRKWSWSIHPIKTKHSFKKLLSIRARYGMEFKFNHNATHSLYQRKDNGSNEFGNAQFCGWAISGFRSWQLWR